MAKLVAYFSLLTSAVIAAPLRRRPSCPPDCDASRCPLRPRDCYYGHVTDACGCCTVCALGEAERCGGGGGGLPACGHGLRCDDAPGTHGGGGGGGGGRCVCLSSGPVCGSDGRTYPSMCRLRAQVGESSSAVTAVRRGRCDSEMQHPGSLRYKFNFIADVVDKIIPAVVHLDLYQRVPFSGEEVSVSSASGFVVSEDGWIVTNAHVLTNKQRVEVQLSSGAQYNATVQDADGKMDIALVKIQPHTPLPVLRLGRSWDLRPGEFVVAVGSPFSLQSTVTTGIVSTAQRAGTELGFRDSEMEYIQTDAMINFGNSGGPLVNLDGDVVGINTLKVAAGISFAVPVDKIIQFLAESHHRRVNGNTLQKKMYIGVRMLQLSPSLIQDLKEHEDAFPDVSWGVYVYEVIPGTAASSAGMINHDVIVAIDGRPVSTMREVSDAVQSNAVLSVVVRRKHGEVTLTVLPRETNQSQSQ